MMKKLTTALLISALTVVSYGITSPAIADHGKGMRMMHHSGGSWKSTLTEEQSKKLAKLKLDYKKKKYPLKARLKQAKIDLALLTTSNDPGESAINKKIDQIVKLKKQKMQLKARHKIAVRKLLNDEQRVKFDMKMLKNAYHGRKHGGCKHRKGHH